MGSLYEAPTPECRQFECLFELPEPFEVHREDSIPQPARAFAIDQPDEHPQMPGYRKHYSRITAEETRLRAAFTASDRNPAP